MNDPVQQVTWTFVLVLLIAVVSTAVARAVPMRNIARFILHVVALAEKIAEGGLHAISVRDGPVLAALAPDDRDFIRFRGGCP